MRAFHARWNGRETFQGRLLHASEYKNPEPFRGRQVLVVGSGCTGMEIAYDLAEGGAARVWLSVRTPPNMLLREAPGGLPGDVRFIGYVPRPAGLGYMAREAKRAARAIARELQTASSPSPA